MNAPRHFKDLLPEEVDGLFDSLGEKAFRSAQALDWVYRRAARSWNTMTNLPAPLRASLEDRFPLAALAPATRATGSDGTVKTLFRAADGATVEAVAMPRGKFLTVCASSQAGCAMRCAFCLTGRSGFERDLRASEIVDQVLLSSALFDRVAPTHVVLMGMGEPLLNLDEVARAVRIMTAPRAIGLSASRITISTAGVPEGLKRLAAMGLGAGIALSLNATDDETRRRLMPVVGRHPVSEVLAAFKAVPDTVRNPRTIEYVLIAGINDSAAQAAALARIAKSARAKVNLIPFNESPGMDFKAPPESVIELFMRAISRLGVTVTVRRSMGLDICAACGQLAGGKDGQDAGAAYRR